MKSNVSRELSRPIFGPLRVLIVDDEHLVATGLAALVDGLGHQVVGIAPDGETAIAMAGEHKPDVALVDIRMPGMLGTETARKMYEQHHCPSIIVSAYSDEEHLAEIRDGGAQSGVFGYILKPAAQDDLRVTLSVAVQRASIDNHFSGRVSQLERNLANRRTVEQAKWLMVEAMKITEPQAHEKLQRLARDRRRQLVEIAQEVINNNGKCE